ncbi:EAL domain-containing protein [Legionella jordanis]|uniref:EAL domain-containing protein n=1 Tax=Legionella jordanis TaxID=456 RepID=UPI000EFF5F1F|nr:EAL domain-containing protein [Legionella jordanis]RMX21278.1 EAL domain-containing protein [Legionella jordanis]
MYDTKSNIKVLIIDDNPAIHADFKKILGPKESIEHLRLNSLDSQLFDEPSNISGFPHFKLDSAMQGYEAVVKVDQALKQNEPYAVAFLDIRMPPGIDGIETAKKIWQLDPNIQIVLCTAYSDYTWEETIRYLGQRDNLLILKKPFDPITVRQLCCALSHKWQLLQESREYTEQLENKIQERTQSLQELLSVTRSTLESSADGILVMNNLNQVIDFNENLRKLFKIPDEVISSKDANYLLHYIAQKISQSDIFLTLAEKLSKSNSKTKTISLKCKDNHILEIYTQPYKMKDKVSGRIWCFRDITKRAQLEEQLQYQATHDSLTDLPNRILLTERLSQILSQSRRHGNHFCVLFVDLDRFKLINDSFNHIAGDKLLQDVVRRLRAVMREEDILARLGGDEFIAVLDSLQDEAHTANIAQKLLEVFSEPFIINGHEITVTASIGIATYPRDGESIDELLRNADIAMYRAKEQGGNQFQFYTHSLGQKSLAKLTLESELHRAIENEEFILCYQPQIDLATRKLVSAEALIRWQHPERGIILPIDFIPVAEESGLIIPIGEWVLREACRQNKRWQELGFPRIRVAVNVATKQLKQRNFKTVVERILTETGLNPQDLEIEITENIVLTGREAMSIFNDLKQLGVNLALDNFGSGYTILNHLKLFPIDRLKIDPSYITHIHSSKVDEIIIEAIITLAKNLNLDVLAEGVESKEQIDFLKDRQCNGVQGYYFCKPLDVTDFQHFLQNTFSS